jgi:lipopolysaccharide export LptBFGC system permease protein LptF
MDARALAALVATRARQGYEAYAYRVALHARAAFPASLFVAVVAGVVFGLRRDERRGADRTVAALWTAAALVGGCFVVHVVADGLGRAGVLPAALVAWLPAAALAVMAARPWRWRRSARRESTGAVSAR